MLVTKPKSADEKRTVEKAQSNTLWCDEIDKVVDSWSFEQCEEAIRSSLGRFYAIGKALMKIRDNKWYKKSGFSSFEDYCIKRWGFRKSQAYRLIGSSEVIDNLSPIGDTLPQTESQARELAGLDPEEQVEAWKESVKTAPNGKPTASHIKQTKERLLEEGGEEREEIEYDEEKIKVQPETQTRKFKPRSLSAANKPKLETYSIPQIRKAIDAVFTNDFDLFSNNADDFKEKLFTELEKLAC